MSESREDGQVPEDPDDFPQLSSLENKRFELILAAEEAEGLEPSEALMAMLAMRARVMDFPWPIIVERLGYADVASAQSAVRWHRNQAIATLENEARAEILEMSDLRMGMLINAFLPRALLGDYKAADVVIKADARRAKLYKLDEPETASQGARNVIIPSDPEAMVAIMNAIAAGADPYDAVQQYEKGTQPDA